MKEIVLIFIVFSLVTAHVTRNLSREITFRRLNQPASFEDTRIVGGNEAVPNSLPYVAVLRMIFNGSSSSCGASLITTRYVLTVAHCLDDGMLSLEVILGKHKLLETEPTQQTIPTTTYKIHEQFNNETLVNDIGVVYLPTPAKINRYVQLIALPSRADVSNSFAGSEAIASGWGDDYDPTTDGKEVLRYVNVRIITNAVCNETFKDIIDSNICTAGTDKKGVCFGDSGGPLVVNKTLVNLYQFISLEKMR
ncbi:brachyurin-like [Agrilus planipennis]|uniref:Brachyurin-like n=1 Tax=Agrilus planipennis TaxID=224129 RepID=A0A1W4XBR5_AGRPL|nr:brachyurin-like [Agrilus planipennis]